MLTPAVPGGSGGQELGFWRRPIGILNGVMSNNRAFRMWLFIWALTVLLLAQYTVSTSWLSSWDTPPQPQRDPFEALEQITDQKEHQQRSKGPRKAPPPTLASSNHAVGRSSSSAASSPNNNDVSGQAAGRHPTAHPSEALEEAVHKAVRMSVERMARDEAVVASLGLGLGARLLQEVATQIRGSTLGQIPGGQCDLPGRAPPWPNTPVLYVITPTYRRPEQLAELTRMVQTLLLVRNVRWLVIEDAKTPSKHVARLLHESGLQFEHLTAAMPEQYRKRRGAKPKGVAQRNRGLQWLRANATDGVLYFADDDNTYDVTIFEEIRSTNRVSMFPVGLCTKFGLSTPVVSPTGSFIGFYDGWVGGRKFPVDMAGFAVNVKFLLQRPKAQMPFVPGFEEDGFLRSLAPFEPKEVELKADNCTKVLVWHTQSKANAPSPPLDMAKYNHTNLAILKTIIV